MGRLDSKTAVVTGGASGLGRAAAERASRPCGGAQEQLSIRCSSVHPGEVRTPLWEGYVRQTADARGVPADIIVAEARSRTPLGDFPLPADIAAAVAFLCSDDARFITGAELVVDGGVVYCDTFEPRS